MYNNILEMWQRIITDNVEPLSGLYVSLADYVSLIFAVGAISVALVIIFKLLKGK